MKINKVLIFGVVGLSAVVLIGYLKKGDTGSTSLVDVAKEKIADVVETGNSTHCVMSTTEGGTIETWTKGEKVKAYGTNIGGSAGMGYMISDGQWAYMWVEGETKGLKYPITDEETPRSEGEGSEGEMPEFDMQQELADYQAGDYKQECSEEAIPDSTFVPPAGIEFMDMMESLGGSLEDLKQE